VELDDEERELLHLWRLHLGAPGPDEEREVLAMREG